jgi:Right handed beta helix region
MVLRILGLALSSPPDLHCGVLLDRSAEEGVMRREGLRAVAVAVLAVSTIVFVHAEAAAADDCTFFARHHTWALGASCTTDATIVVPVSRLEGRGFTITAVDPPGGHFLGAVVRNGTTELDVSGLRVTAAGLTGATCNSAGALLAGILLDGADGSVTFSTVTGINQGDSGCQEGNGIVVRNAVSAPRPVNVRVEGNVVAGYQKTGIVVSGAVRAEVVANRLDGGDPVASIARNGIELGFAASGSVRFNLVKGNSYTGANAVGAGVLVVGGPFYGAPFTADVDIADNAIVGADVGVYVDNLEADGSAAEVPTRVAVTGNFISHAAVTNGVPYSAGVFDSGNRDRIISNRIDGAAYDPATIPGSTFEVDVRFAVDPFVRNNR